MADYTQAKRLMAVTTPLGEDALLLVGFQGREAISELFHFQLDLLAEQAQPQAFAALLGQKITARLALPNGDTRYFNGIVQRLVQGQRADLFVAYRIDLVPQLWLLTKRVQSRIFQQITVPDILKAVLAGVDDVHFELTGTYLQRDYCVQYRESDFAFASRLMEEEGICYYFKHSESGHQLVITDTPTDFPDLPAPKPAIYDLTEGGHREAARITRWDKSQEVRAGKYSLQDYCFELPASNLSAAQSTPVSATAGSVSHPLTAGNAGLEIYDFPGRYAQRFDGIDPGGGDRGSDLQHIFEDNQRTARIRMEQEAAQSLAIDGAGNCITFVPGYNFTLDRHFDGNGAYTLTRVEHQARLSGDYRSGMGLEAEYSNSFRCIPRDLRYRPPQTTPRPVIAGTQTATVVGPPGDDEIFTDKYGRVKVQFHWDRQGKMNAGSSCWVRVSQGWAGKGFGAIMIPRVGHEVVIGFEEGDPDTPIILGSVYNGAQMPPFTLPDHKTQSGFKTQTHQSTNPQDSSGLGFEDTDDGEHVHLHSEKYMTHSVESHLFQNVGREHHVNVGHFHTRQVGGLPGMNHRFTPADLGSGGSGGGGGLPGSGSGAGAVQGTAQGMENTWTPTIDSDGKAVSMDFVMGWKRTSAAGLEEITTLGQRVTNIFNPLGLIDLFGGEYPGPGVDPPGQAGASAALGKALPTMGNTTTVIGCQTMLHYGPTITVNRGPMITAASHADALGVVACRIAAISYIAADILQMFNPILDNRYKDKVAEEVGFVLNEVILEVWAVLEISTMAATGAKIAAGIIVPPIGIGLLVGAAAIEINTRRENRAKELAEQVVEEEVEGAGNASMQTHTCDSQYTIAAPGIVLVSSPDLDSTESSDIQLLAMGNELTSGSVLIHGTGQTCVSGGAQACIYVQTEEEVTGQIIVDCGAVGSITLQSGIAKEPNHLIMNPEGIVAISLLQIKLEVEENIVTLDPTGITLQSAESTVKVTPAGITLSCGPSAIEIGPAGITMSGPIVTIEADGEVTVSAPAVMVSE